MQPSVLIGAAIFTLRMPENGAADLRGATTMNKALLPSCALVGTLAMAPITARAECIDREQAFREYRHLADGALPCNNGKGVQMINGEAVRAKPTRGGQRTLDWLAAHPDLPRSEKDRIYEQGLNLSPALPRTSTGNSK
jgi:hypothetical protein